MNRNIVVAATLVLLAGCSSAPAADDAAESLAQADTAGIAEGTLEATGVLRVANEVAVAELKSASGVGLSAQAAEGIDAVRVGDDESRGTADDVRFATLRDLDAVSYVGPKAFRSMLAYARRQGWLTSAPPPPPPAGAETYSATPGSAIADHAATASEITVPTTGPSGAISVPIDISHTYVGDLVVTLSHNGTSVTLSNHEGGATHDIKRTFSSNAFAGIDRRGVWRLEVRDDANGDVGTLNGWGLAFAAGATPPPSPPPADPSCAASNVAGCGPVVTLRADDHYWYARTSSPFAIGSYGDLWAGSVSGDFQVSGFGYPNARLEDDRGAQTRLYPSWTSMTGLSARLRPVTAVAWGGAPGTGDSSNGVTVAAQNVSYAIERTRDVEDHGTIVPGLLAFRRSLGAELRGLSVGFDIEVSADDNFTYPCPVTVKDSPDPSRPLIATRELGRFTGALPTKRSLIATPPIEIEMSGDSCGARKASAGPDLSYRITNVRIFRP